MTTHEDNLADLPENLHDMELSDQAALLENLHRTLSEHLGAASQDTTKDDGGRT